MTAGAPRGWQPGDELPRELVPLADGVIGYTVEYAGALWVPIIAATDPGSGAISRYLDGLPLDRRICGPTVISEKLAGMLARRGFVQVPYLAPRSGNLLLVWMRPAPWPLVGF